MLFQRTQRKRFRLFRFTLRSMLAVVTLFALGLGWKVNQANRQRDAVQAIRDYGGSVEYDFPMTPALGVTPAQIRTREPEWLIDLVGVDFFYNVKRVNLRYREGHDPKLASDRYSPDLFAQLSAFPRLQHLELHGRQGTDEALEILSQFRDLQTIRLLPCGNEGPRITGDGLHWLTRLESLRTVEIHGARLKDDALAALGQVRSLEEIVIHGRACRFTDAGLIELARLKHLQRLELADTCQFVEVSDVGIERLVELRQLETVQLRGANISDWGLRLLSELPSLKFVEVSSPAITRQGEAEFRSLSPATLFVHSYKSLADSVRDHVAYVNRINRIPEFTTIGGMGLDRVEREMVVWNLADDYFDFSPKKWREFNRRALDNPQISEEDLVDLITTITFD